MFWANINILKSLERNISRERRMSEAELSSMTLAQLQSRLAASGLKKTGRKAELVARLLGQEGEGATPAFHGPFSCTFPGCCYSTSDTKLFGRHWNSKHLGDASKASFLDQATGNTVTIYDVFKLVIQCQVCGAVRCDAERSGSKDSDMSGIKMHLEWTHPEEVKAASGLAQLYRVLQDGRGRRLKQEGDFEG